MAQTKNSCESTSHIEHKKDIYEQVDAPQNYHTWIEINKSAIDHNINQFKKIIGDKILAPVIKGNAYGHGLLEIAHLCQKNNNVAWLCTATLSEAIKIRKNGITKPVLVLSHIDKNPEQAALLNISVVAYNSKTIKILNETGSKCSKKINIHIKVDTGLARLGIPPSETLELIKYAKTCEYISIQGIWTHFAEAHSEDRSYTNKQIQLFSNLIKKLEKYKIHIPLIHTCNTAGTATIHSHTNNLFRLGIGLYGYWPSDYVKKMAEKISPGIILKPVLSWKARIFSIKKIPKNSFVGYDRTFQTKKESILATLPIGYFDGYERRLSNKSLVIIHGQVAPILGIVSMNVLIVDITELKNVSIGDEAILIGDNPQNNISHLSAIGRVNPRELTTKINPEIQKIIIE